MSTTESTTPLSLEVLELADQIPGPYLNEMGHEVTIEADDEDVFVTVFDDDGEQLLELMLQNNDADPHDDGILEADARIGSHGQFLFGHPEDPEMYGQEKTLMEASDDELELIHKLITPRKNEVDWDRVEEFKDKIAIIPSDEFKGQVTLQLWGRDLRLQFFSHNGTANSYVEQMDGTVTPKGLTTALYSKAYDLIQARANKEQSPYTYTTLTKYQSMALWLRSTGKDIFNFDTIGTVGGRVGALKVFQPVPREKVAYEDHPLVDQVAVLPDPDSAMRLTLRVGGKSLELVRSRRNGQMRFHTHIHNVSRAEQKEGAATALYVKAREFMQAYADQTGEIVGYNFNSASDAMVRWASTKGQEIFEWSDPTIETGERFYFNGSTTIEPTSDMKIREPKPVEELITMVEQDLDLEGTSTFRLGNKRLELQNVGFNIFHSHIENIHGNGAVPGATSALYALTAQVLQGYANRRRITAEHAISTTNQNMIAWLQNSGPTVLNLTSDNSGFNGVSFFGLITYPPQSSK